ncbi:MAG: 3-dehydroquinate synthase [Lachnospiraceae bacterium]|nr:3-dehydroquinate synthase [Lachnospiraceae bacterium]
MAPTSFATEDHAFVTLTALSLLQQDNNAYDILICGSTHFCELHHQVRKLFSIKRRVLIITDTNIAPLYLSQVRMSLNDTVSELHSIVLPAGESQKTLQTVQHLYQILMENHFDRDDFLVALGGGVIGDITGFTAATYLRGISYIQVPTTLLAQTDSSIGGKTGVDFVGYKNMIGAFYPPKTVIMNLNTLNTLPHRQFAAGMAEIIKYGLIWNATFFNWLTVHGAQILSLDQTDLLQMIQSCCEYKRDVVQKDPKDRGIRKILNYGHTLGHALEKYKNFSLLHGECVGLGMLAAARISRDRGLLSVAEEETIRSALSFYSLPTCTEISDPDALMQMMFSDKKVSAGHLQFVLLDQIGHCFLAKDVSSIEIKTAIEAITK